ncbi:MAG: acetyl-CoA carboxylase biotin carboxyl carrier protein [Chitinophagales bacterium]
MELKHIKELMAVMSRTGTKRLKWKEGDFELILERPDLEPPPGQYTEQYLASPGESFQAQVVNRADQTLLRGAEQSASRMTSTSTESSEPQQVDLNSKYVTSPMVGTFYAAPSPTDPIFVKVGDKVEKNTVVCIIEAMKVMNEIKANVSGTLVEILMEPGQPVEFGTKLFRIVESS